MVNVQHDQESLCRHFTDMDMSRKEVLREDTHSIVCMKEFQEYQRFFCKDVSKTCIFYTLSSPCLLLWAFGITPVDVPP